MQNTVIPNGIMHIFVFLFSALLVLIMSESCAYGASQAVHTTYLNPAFTAPMNTQTKQVADVYVQPQGPAEVVTENSTGCGGGGRSAP